MSMKKSILMLVIDEYVSINGINIYVHDSNVGTELLIRYSTEVHGPIPHISKTPKLILVIEVIGST